ncbi:MAG TPA: ribose-phosphate pyrophosphokinase [Vicinamibacterales bacterium]
MSIFAGPASLRLGARVCELLGLAPAGYECRRFPDGEVQMDVLESVRGHDVFIVQSTSPPVESHLMELLLLADACRRAGAGRMIAVIPYFGYARQDRRAGRSSLGVRVVADLLGTAGFDRLMLIHAHTPAIEGCFSIPIDHLTAVPVLVEAIAREPLDGVVVVAPDLGAAKLAREYARRLHAPFAVVHKTRLDGDEVAALEVIGDVRARQPLIVDDMLSTGATIEAATDALRAAGAVVPLDVVVTHALGVGRAHEVLTGLPIGRLIATDTVETTPAIARLQVATVAPLIATAIERCHRGESLVDLRTEA